VTGYRRVLVTGGAGFIGSCYVRMTLDREPDTRITVLDKLTYAGNRANLQPAFATAGDRLRFVQGDIADDGVVRTLVAEADAVVNFAAETHVDRSILEPEAFLASNLVGVQTLLIACHDARKRLLQVSTDEVYGSVESGTSRETDPLSPSSPYSAAKAGADLLVLGWHRTYGSDAVVTRGANTYGPYQHAEKLIPLFVTNAIDDQPLPMYGDGRQRRDWLHVSDHASAIWHVLTRGKAGEIYNIPGNAERANRDVVRALLERLGKPWSLVRSVPDRPGHDRRYAMDGAKLAALGFRHRMDFERGISETVDWYVQHEDWWRAIKSGDWDAYYERQYGARLSRATTPG
jgi:dTDP-glucose 4,6-dehydratase